MNSDTATTALACQGCGNTAHEIARSDKLDVSLCGECWDRRTDAAEAVISNGRTVGTSYGLPVGEGEGVGAGLGTLPPTRLPTPTGNSGTEDEIDLLLGDYATGVLVPVEVELGSMPARAGSTMNAIAEHMRLLMGLRLAVGEERALPYAVSVPVRAGLVKDASSASKAIRSLVRFGVVKHVGALPPLRPGCPGTKLYTPPDGMVRSG